MSEEQGLFWLVILALILVFVGSDAFVPLAGRAIEAAVEFLRGLR